MKKAQGNYLFSYFTLCQLEHNTLITQLQLLTCVVHFVKLESTVINKHFDVIIIFKHKPVPNFSVHVAVIFVVHSV